MCRNYYYFILLHYEVSVYIIYVTRKLPTLYLCINYTELLAMEHVTHVFIMQCSVNDTRTIIHKAYSVFLHWLSPVVTECDSHLDVT